MFVYAVGLAFKVNCVNNIFDNIKTQFIVYVGLKHFMLKLLLLLLPCLCQMN
jgi:hypothetical protein